MDDASGGEDDGQKAYQSVRYEQRKALQDVNTVLDAYQLLASRLPDADFPGFKPRKNVEERAEDGSIYPLPKIESVDRIVEDFHADWNSAFSSNPRPKVAPVPELSLLKNLARICLVLKTIHKGKDLLRHFCHHHHVTGDSLCLPLRPDVLNRILRQPETSRLFQAAQYRVARRDYPNEYIRAGRTRLILVAGEPMPLKYEADCPSGSFAKVTIWRDVDDENKRYAIKKALNAKYNHQIVQEILALNQLNETGPHPHVVSLVAVLERDGMPMLVLEPAAENDLAVFLASYQENSENPTEEINLDEERKVLRTAFGCLSHGLCYLHIQMRHKDIKLENILHVKEKGGVARLVFADFGTAHYYGEGNANKTNNAWHFARKCTAPEVLESSRDYMEHRKNQLDKSRRECQGRHHDRADASPAMRQLRADKEHDVKSDIFSLGACFMQILSVLVRDPLPKPADMPESDFIFAEHLKGILDWASRHEQDEPASGLKAAFRVARGMLQYEKRDRWTLNQVIRHLITPEAGGKWFCTDECRRKALVLIEKTLQTPTDVQTLIPSRLDTRMVMEESEEGDYLVSRGRSQTATRTTNGAIADEVRQSPVRVAIGKEEEKENKEPAVYFESALPFSDPRFQSTSRDLIANTIISPKSSSW